MFFQIPQESKIAEYLLKIAQTASQWQEYHQFNVHLLNTDNLLERDNFLKWLHDRHPFSAAILSLPPHTCYDWHIDTNRGVAINMLLSHKGRSVCLFADQRDTTFEFQELDYQPHRYYLFNTQRLHVVFNFDQTRYLFGVEFREDKNSLSFESLLAEIEVRQFLF